MRALVQGVPAGAQQTCAGGAPVLTDPAPHDGVHAFAQGVPTGVQQACVGGAPVLPGPAPHDGVHALAQGVPAGVQQACAGGKPVLTDPAPDGGVHALTQDVPAGVQQGAPEGSSQMKRAKRPPAHHPDMPPPACTWVRAGDGSAGIVVASLWSMEKRRILAVRVVYADGSTHDVPTAALGGLQKATGAEVPEEQRAAVGAAICQHQAVLFTAGLEVPNFQAAGVLFPDGCVPPPPTRPGARPTGAGHGYA
jgi:hypothetical protein